MRYVNAGGGCIHFSCMRCHTDFCGGCSSPFLSGKVHTYEHTYVLFHAFPIQKCNKFESCKEKGLHAHHTRNCLFYLRDLSVKELQDFLCDNGVAFHVSPPEEEGKGLVNVEESGIGYLLVP